MQLVCTTDRDVGCTAERLEAHRRHTHLYELMRDAQPAIAEMELAGLHFDQVGHVGLIRTSKRAKKNAARQLAALVGPGVNFASPSRRAAWLESTLDETARAIAP